MKNLQSLTEQLRDNSASLATVTDLYDHLRADLISNKDHPVYLNEFTLGGLIRAINTLAENTERLSNSLAEALAESEGR